jgi:N-acetylmuramoyl-L-alanine amidase
LNGLVATGATSGRRRRGPTRRRPAHRLRLWISLIVLLFIASSLWVLVPAVRTASGFDGDRDAAVAVDPALFAPGACVALPPTQGDNGLTVFLDAGHGGLDPGAVGTTSSGATVEEAAETLPVELDTAGQLRAQGYRVVVSRTADSSVARLDSADVSDGVLSLQGAHDDVAARALCADKAGAQVLVGIYFDSGGSSYDAGSLTTYDTARPFAASNLRLANLLQQDVLTAMNDEGWGIPDAGVTSDSQEGSLVPTSSTSPLAIEAANYGHLLLLGPPEAGYNPTPSTMPGAVIEPLFVTDPFEATIAASSQGQMTIARGIDLAIRQYLAPSTPSRPSG